MEALRYAPNRREFDCSDWTDGDVIVLAADPGAADYAPDSAKVVTVADCGGWHLSDEIVSFAHLACRCGNQCHGGSTYRVIAVETMPAALVAALEAVEALDAVPLARAEYLRRRRELVTQAARVAWDLGISTSSLGKDYAEVSEWWDVAPVGATEGV